jgi:diguanylate cyclase (GGDEF)-like protein
LAVSLVIAVRVALIVCAAEFAIMLVFEGVPANTAGRLEAAFHAFLLAALATPLVLFWVIRPHIQARHAAIGQLAGMNRMLRREIDERMAAEEKLRAHEHDLEMQIQEMDYVKDLIEQQAADAVGLAEDLAVQKQAVEESQRRTEYLANHDTLTGLPNRRQFERILTHLKEVAQANNGSLTLVFVDLDNFKTVNDTLGHQRGDDLLVQVADLLQRSTRDSDLVARLGGDEFAVVSTQFGHGRDRELQGFAERIRSSLHIPVDACGSVIPVSATLGIATYPADAVDEQELLQRADCAMYAAKDRGRNCVVHYHEIAEEAARDDAAAD